MTSYIDGSRLYFSDGSSMGTSGATSFGGSGYMRDNTGTIIQWGQNGSAYNGIVTYFPVSFPNNCVGVYSAYTGGGGGITDCSYSWNTSYFYHDKNTSFSWIAIGY